ncbi:MAG: hypothetical protein LBN20_01630, partial [Endomicrobium sp.]|nr:hypothetical protein [Endomicrobium sp.]
MKDKQNKTIFKHSQKTIRKHLPRIVFSLFLFFILIADVCAIQTLTTYAQDSRQLFYFDIYGAEDGADWTLSASYIQALKDAADYWSLLLGNLPINTNPIRITVVGSNLGGFFARAEFNATGNMTNAAWAILNNAAVGGGNIKVNWFDFVSDPISILPYNRGLSLVGILTHELTHLMSNALLHSEYFHNIGAITYFQGPNVMELLENGLPLTNHGADGHDGLRNSLMSGVYANWGILMEAELALCQDLGIAIDRKNFYGRSIYKDNLDIVVLDNFYARNSSGTAYLVGVYNETPLTVGLHIYGTGNTVEMKGRVLSRGDSAVGIRVDGSDNKLTIAPESEIATDGQNAVALLVTYGKSQTIAHRGILSAQGGGGIGARFDFGCSINATYVGSYINAPFREALMEQFNISGEIKASSAAIYMSPNAYVKEINIMQGAQITGGIISDWDRNTHYYNAAYDIPYYKDTNLNFGFLADSAGNSTAQPNGSFHLVYDGDILGKKSLNANIVGGTFTYSAKMQTRSVNVFPNAVLEIVGDARIESEILDIQMGGIFSMTGDENMQTINIESATISGTVNIEVDFAGNTADKIKIDNSNGAKLIIGQSGILNITLIGLAAAVGDTEVIFDTANSAEIYFQKILSYGDRNYALIYDNPARQVKVKYGATKWNAFAYGYQEAFRDISLAANLEAITGDEAFSNAIGDNFTIDGQNHTLDAKNISALGFTLNNKQVEFKDISFTSFSSITDGSVMAINGGQITIKAENGNVLFEGNKANGINNDIALQGTAALELNAASGKTITMNGGILGSGATINKTGSGDLRFNAGSSIAFGGTFSV